MIADASVSNDVKQYELSNVAMAPFLLRYAGALNADDHPQHLIGTKITEVDRETTDDR
jgi:hypothetical protein